LPDTSVGKRSRNRSNESRRAVAKAAKVSERKLREAAALAKNNPAAAELVRAGVKKIPCVVVEMSDEVAFRELLLSNAQGELSPLEIGLHLDLAIGRGKPGRGNKNGIADYARNMGKSRDAFQDYVEAARVARKSGTQVPDLIPHTRSLSVIHRADHSDWSALVAAMLKDGWSKETTELRVEAVKALDMRQLLAALSCRRNCSFTSGIDFRASVNRTKYSISSNFRPDSTNASRFCSSTKPICNRPCPNATP
jgi:hypothetical protein